MLVPLLAAFASLVILDAPSGFQVEAEKLTVLTLSTFYDGKKDIWRAPVQSSEMVGDQGYTFWPSLLAWQAVIEAARIQPVKFKQLLTKRFETLEKYFDKTEHAYCAWTYFPGNDDKFYDDNAWAAVACIEAYEVVPDAKYLARAREIFDSFLRKGWDSERGGMYWGTKSGVSDRRDRTVSATAASALAGLLIDKALRTASNREWSKRALAWIRENLQTPDGLVFDGFYGKDGKRMDTIWTYNTGVPIRAAVEYYEATKDKSYRDWARKLGDAAINRKISPLYDGAVKDIDARYWYDAVYFVQYLADGLTKLSATTREVKYLNEAKREAEYCMRNLKDKDGLYWRNMRLWTISEERTKAFCQLVKQDGPAFFPEESERSYEPSEIAKPARDRKLVKTLLANAGMARMLWILLRK